MPFNSLAALVHRCRLPATTTTTTTPPTNDTYPPSVPTAYIHSSCNPNLGKEQTPSQLTKALRLKTRIAYILHHRAHNGGYAPWTAHRQRQKVNEARAEAFRLADERLMIARRARDEVEAMQTLQQEEDEAEGGEEAGGSDGE